MLEDLGQPNIEEPLLPEHALPDNQEAGSALLEVGNPVSSTEGSLSEEDDTTTVSQPDSQSEEPVDTFTEGQSSTAIEVPNSQPEQPTAELGLTDLAERLGTDQNEIQQKMAKDLDAAIVYGLTTIRNKHEFGEELSLSEKTLEAICNFTESHPEIKTGRIMIDHSEWDMAFLSFEQVEATIADDLQAMTSSQPSVDLPRLTFSVEQIQPTHNNRFLAWEAGPLNSQAYFIERNTRYETNEGQDTLVDERRTREVTATDFEVLQKLLKQLTTDLDQHQAA